jgi:very-short-patch-repair endonuclease
MSGQLHTPPGAPFTPTSTGPTDSGERPDPRASVDREIARLASRQHGVVSRAQLVELGLDGNAIDHRVRVGRIHRLHRGVYAVGHAAPSFHARAMAAVLACGSAAALSHRSAAALWGIDLSWRSPVEVSAPGNRRRAGLLVHRSLTLRATDVTVHQGIVVTTAARTLIDLADVLDPPRLARAVNEAQVLRLVTRQQLAVALTAATGRRAAGRLNPFVHRSDAPTRSVFEDAFLVFVDRHGLPRPEVNQKVAGHRVDVLWRRHRLVAELDGRTFHDHDQPFEQDRERDADLLAAGHPVVRITWRRMTRQPAREAVRLRAILAARDGSGQRGSRLTGDTVP